MTAVSTYQREQTVTDNTCKSCFKTSDMEPVEVKRDGKWVASTVRRCTNPECHAVREGTLDDRLQHVRSVYGYKYFGDYELSPEQSDAVWEAKAIAERVPLMLDALKEAERFMAYFADETDRTFVGPGTPKTCLTLIRDAIAQAAA